VQSAKHADDPVGYDAAVIGSAAYYFHWMKPATEFVCRNRDTLTSRPVWLFSSGPLGTEGFARNSRLSGEDLWFVVISTIWNACRA
jgi:menaquinone-dependent protoporphyrinogen IX oxidase